MTVEFRDVSRAQTVWTHLSSLSGRSGNSGIYYPKFGYTYLSFNMDLYTAFFGHSFFALLDDFLVYNAFYSRPVALLGKIEKSLVLRLPLKAHFFLVTADIGTYPKIRILVTRAATTK